MHPPRLSLFSSMRYGASTNILLPTRSSVPAASILSTTSTLRTFQHQTTPSTRPFTTSQIRTSWLQPKRKLSFKDPKGRPRVATGGSVRGTTVIWGDYGLRMKDHDRRISAAQLKNGEDVIRRRLRGLNFRLFSRFGANVAVYTKGNESRMGTGKGSFDYWSARVSVSRIIFELKGDIHEQIIRDAMRLAAAKMPGLYEFVKKGDPPMMGLTKLAEGVTMEDLKRPRRKLPGEQTAHRLPGTD